MLLLEKVQNIFEKVLLLKDHSKFHFDREIQGVTKLNN